MVSKEKTAAISAHAAISARGAHALTLPAQLQMCVGTWTHGLRSSLVRSAAVQATGPELSLLHDQMVSRSLMMRDTSNINQHQHPAASARSSYQKHGCMCSRPCGQSHTCGSWQIFKNTHSECCEWDVEAGGKIIKQSR